VSGVLPIEPTHYQRLGLPEDCTATELQIAWLRIAPTLPPPLTPRERRDLPADRTEVRRAEDRRLARAVLGDPARRAVYDAWLARERAVPKSWIKRLLRQD
jgi:curved DNA-binding protein CbpA